MAEQNRNLTHASPSGCRIGIDVGGTFTDFVLVDDDTGATTVFKEPSVPQDPSASVARGLPTLLARAGRRPQDVARIVHGTTIALNAIIQRRGASLGLVVSEGMRGVLEIGRSQMPSAFSYLVPKEDVLVKRRLIRAVSTRILANGDVLCHADDVELDAVADVFRRAGVQAVCVLLLHAWHRPDVEADVAQHLAKRLPGIAVTASAGVWPQQREYERGLIALMNAYVQPMMSAYLQQLAQRVQNLGIVAPIYVTANNGGTLSLATAAQRPIDTVLSGPASGVVAAAHCARTAAAQEIITVDMGGTSADMSIITEGEPETTHRTHIGGMPLIVPVVNISAIGAGGGSIVWVDAHGVLKVGPLSAGADPGPVCYGKGGLEPTVTDCYLVAGFLNPQRFAGGRMRLDAAAAYRALDAIGAKMGLPVDAQRAPRAAEAALRVTTAVMTAEMAKSIAQRGFDLRRFTLLPYGGAGPTQANLIADDVGLSRILIPSWPGTFCALGATMADLKRDYVRSVSVALSQGDAQDEAAAESISVILRALAQEAHQWIVGESAMLQRHDLAVSLDMRYRGQAFDLPVPCAWDGRVLDASAAIEGFHREHKRFYHFRDEQAVVEVTTIRLRITGYVDHGSQRTPHSCRQGPARPSAFGTEGSPEGGRRNPDDRPAPASASIAPAAAQDAQDVHMLYWNGAAHPAKVLARQDLPVGSRLDGPAILAQEDTTVVVLPGWHVQVDGAGNLLIEKSA